MLLFVLVNKVLCLADGARSHFVVELVVSEVLFLARCTAILGLGLPETFVFRTALNALVSVHLAMPSRVQIPSCFMNLAVLGNSDAVKIFDIVVERVIVLVMDDHAFWNIAVIVFPNGDVQRNLLLVPEIPPSPEISLPVLLLRVRVSVVLPTIEYDGVRV